jgi:hypothetical protein
MFLTASQRGDLKMGYRKCQRLGYEVVRLLDELIIEKHADLDEIACELHVCKATACRYVRALYRFSPKREPWTESFLKDELAKKALHIKEEADSRGIVLPFYELFEKTYGREDPKEDPADVRA